MAKHEAVFIEAECSQYNQKFYLRYDYAADDVWVQTYGVKEKNVQLVHQAKVEALICLRQELDHSIDVRIVEMKILSDVERVGN